MRSENSTTKIGCTNNTRLLFNRFQYVHITNLEFIGCGGNQVKGIQEFVMNNTKFDGQDVTGTALELIKTTAQIINSTFVSHKGTFRKCADIEHLGLERSCSNIGNIISVGGAIISTNSTVNISHSKFKDNAAFVGGTILAEQHSIIVMSKNVFTNNSAIYGGVVWSFFSAITIISSNFHSNTAVLSTRIGSGGVLCSEKSTVIMSGNSEFLNNMATFNGGAMYSKNCTMSIKAAVIHYNSANYPGGALFAYRSNISIQASNFDNNTAKFFKGGALYSQDSNISMQASRFCNNKAYESGGVLYLKAGTITVARCVFCNNSASYGGAPFAQESFVTMNTSNFYSNSATEHGGALYAYSDTTITSNITIEGSYFHDNKARGGATM